MGNGSEVEHIALENNKTATAGNAIYVGGSYFKNTRCYLQFL